jgi:site-specific recombinase XerD
MALRIRGGKFHYRFQFDGKEYTGSTGLAATKPNESAARDMEAGHRQRLREGHQPTPRPIVREFSDAAEQFLKWDKAEHREHPNSHHRIVTSFSSLKEFFGNKPVTMLDEGHIENYKMWRVGEHKVRDVTLRHDLHSLSRFFIYAMTQHWARENPVRKVKIPSDKDAIRIHVLTPAEESQYFSRASKNRDLHDVATLILNQGMRPDEVVCLRKEDVEVESGMLYIRHGKSRAARRILHLINDSRQILSDRIMGKSPWIFPSKRKPGEHITRLNNAHDRVCENATKDGVTLNFVLYDLRHTFATRMAQAGVDLATLAAILGHNSIRIVQRYIHPMAEHQRAAMGLYEQERERLQEKPPKQVN